MLRPHQCVVPSGATGIKLREVEADCYLRIKEGAKGGLTGRHDSRSRVSYLRLRMLLQAALVERQITQRRMVS